MPEAVIIDAARTPFGAVHGAFSTWHPARLLGEAFAALARRAAFDPEEIGEVVAGCIEQVGGQSGNVARGGVLAAGWPQTLGATTVDHGAFSGVQCLRLAAALVSSGAQRFVIAGAVDLPSVVPRGAGAMGRHPYGRPWAATVADLVPPGVAADRLARRRGIGRDAQDRWALRSIDAARRSAGDGTPSRALLASAACIADEVLAARPATLDELASFATLHDPEGTVTAGNAAPAADGAAVVALGDATWCRDNGTPTLAVLRAGATAAAAPDDPVTAAATAARAALRRAGLTIDAIDLVDVHEAYAVTALAIVADLGIDPARVNVHGGALAFGDPGATSGLAGTVALTHALAAGAGRLGLQIVAGPGDAGAIVLERCVA